MTNTEEPCESVQQLIAMGQPLGATQQNHFDACSHCQTFQQEILQIDRLVQKNVHQPVPAGFVDRVMTRIPMSAMNTAYENLPGERLLLAVCHSSLLQSLLLGLGIIVGLTQIVRFILSIFIVSALIAN